jgi:hypothetical protein
MKRAIFRGWQRTPTNRTHFLSWPNHQVGFALGAFDRMEFDSFDFVRVKVGHLVPQIQKGLALVV